MTQSPHDQARSSASEPVSSAAGQGSSGKRSEPPVANLEPITKCPTCDPPKFAPQENRLLAAAKLAA
jgi:hypothetical protein